MHSNLKWISTRCLGQAQSPAISRLRRNQYSSNETSLSCIHGIGGGRDSSQSKSSVTQSRKWQGDLIRPRCCPCMQSGSAILWKYLWKRMGDCCHRIVMGILRYLCTLRLGVPFSSRGWGSKEFFKKQTFHS